MAIAGQRWEKFTLLRFLLYTIRVKREGTPEWTFLPLEFFLSTAVFFIDYVETFILRFAMAREREKNRVSEISSNYKS